jgi:hypothetical protein
LLNALAICLRTQAKYPEAERLYRRGLLLEERERRCVTVFFSVALAIRQALLGELHQDTAQSHNSLGCLHQDLGIFVVVVVVVVVSERIHRLFFHSIGRYEQADYHLKLALS